MLPGRNYFEGQLIGFAFNAFLYHTMNVKMVCYEWRCESIDFPLIIRFPWLAMYSSAQAGPITCGKPILKSTVPSLCTIHVQKAQKHVTQALRKAGLNVSSSSKLAPKFHVIVTEYVRQIQAKRKAAKWGNLSRVVDNEVTASWAVCPLQRWLVKHEWQCTLLE